MSGGHPKSGVVVTKFHDRVELVATLYHDDHPQLDAFDRRIVESKQSQPADFLQSMEILMRRAHEQGKLK